MSFLLRKMMKAVSANSTNFETINNWTQRPLVPAPQEIEGGTQIDAKVPNRATSDGHVATVPQALKTARKKFHAASCFFKSHAGRFFMYRCPRGINAMYATAVITATCMFSLKCAVDRYRGDVDAS